MQVQHFSPKIHIKEMDDDKAVDYFEWFNSALPSAVK